MPKVSCKTKKCLNWKDGSAIIKDSLQPWWVLSSTVKGRRRGPRPLRSWPWTSRACCAMFHPHLFLFWGRISLCNPGCPGTHYVDQTSLKPQEKKKKTQNCLYLCLCLWAVRIQGMSHHTWILNAFLEIKNMQSLLIASKPSDNRVFGLYL